MTVKSIKYLKLSIILIGSLFYSNASAQAGEWFHHKFGELRAYHGDWLNVCQDNGNGLCRTVQLPVEGGDSFFANRRLVVAITDDGNFTLEIFQRHMPTPLTGNIKLRFNNKLIELDESQYENGSPEGYNVQETISITDPALTAMIVEQMKADDRVCIAYYTNGNTESSDQYTAEAQFALRGITSGLNAIEKLLAQRN